MKKESSYSVHVILRNFVPKNPVDFCAFYGELSLA